MQLVRKLCSRADLKRSTIFALSSGSGKAGVAVVRISGPDALMSLERIGVKTTRLLPRKLQLSKLICPLRQTPLDTGMAVWFPAPKSYTGEDVCELFIHGGRAVISGVLSALGQIESLRPAEPGEFTKRAFINGKLDLTEVEGLSDLINAETESQRLVALRQLNGELSSLYADWRNRLIKAVAHLEAILDFGEEEQIGPDTLKGVDDEVASVAREIQVQLDNSRYHERINSGIHVAIVGKPNTGKSSLLNVLCQRPAAIVTPMPGTTRDVLEVSLDLGGYAVQMLDTAGLRETADPIELEGVKRAMQTHKTADILLVMMDASQILLPSATTSFGDGIRAGLDEIFPETSDDQTADVLVVCNKIDSVSDQARVSSSTSKVIQWRTRDIPVVFTSCLPAKTGIDVLLNMLVSSIDLRSKSCWDGCQIFSRQRHQLLLRKCVDNLVGYETQKDLVLRAEKIRSAIYSLAKITGVVTQEDILDVIFRDFCIGK